MVERIGHYRVVRKIGQGGMGVVFEAMHELIGRRVAIKVLHPDLAKNPELSARFLNEARAANLVQHSGIVNVFEFDRLPDGQPFIVMDYLDGRSLEQHLREAPTPLSVFHLVDIALQLARALEAAHEKGIIHRDLKPANVMLVAENKETGKLVAKILDFGIAHVGAEHSLFGITQVQTQLGRTIGTPPYMAPEQCRGLDQLTGAADVYALGVLLYEMLAGHPPFVGETAGDTMAMHILSPVPPIGELRPETPEHLGLLVSDMLAKQPAERPSMPEVLEDLAAIATTTGATEPRAGRPLAALRSLAPAAPPREPRNPRSAARAALLKRAQRTTLAEDEAAQLPEADANWVQSPSQVSIRGRLRRLYWVAGIALLGSAVGLGAGIFDWKTPSSRTSKLSGWVEIYSGTQQNLMSVWGTGGNDVWTVGRGGIILHYDGSHFISADSGSREYLFGIWGSSKADVWAVGRKGTLLHFDGTVWRPVQSPTGDDLHAVWGTDSRHIWAVGRLGRILFFDGLKWALIPSGTEYQLRGIWGSNEEDIWVVGGNDANEGVIVHFDGKKWSETEIDNRLEAVWGSRPNDVWAVGGSLGNEGSILRWDGHRWHAIKTARVEWLHGIWGSGAADVWMMGESGSIRHFDGSEFRAIPEETRATFRGLWGSGPGEVWAVASGGVIYRWRGTP